MKKFKIPPRLFFSSPQNEYNYVEKLKFSISKLLILIFKLIWFTFPLTFIYKIIYILSFFYYFQEEKVLKPQKVIDTHGNYFWSIFKFCKVI